MKKTLIKAALVAAFTSLAASVHAAEATKSIEQLTANCAACHGATGVSASAAFPTIAGQHPSYLERALLDYQLGARKNPIMAGQVANLTKADIKKLAAFYAAQEGPLYTPGMD